MRKFYSILLLGLQSSSRVRAASKTWAVLPVRQPPAINDTARFLPNTDGSLGTPPQNVTMLIDIGAQPLFALTPDCLFCPSEGMYDPSYSSSAKVATSQVTFGDLSLGGARGNETVTLGGIFQDVDSPLVFINQMSTDFVPRFSGGHLGMFVPKNTTRRAQSIFARLDDQGQLLNPVWGLRLGGDNPQLTIGALDPNDYEGEINWVPAVGDGPVIQADAWKGYQGNVIPANYPINVTIDTLSKNIYLPELDVFMMNDSFTGPQDTINIYPPNNKTFGILCNGTKFPTIDFSVEINGIDYPVTQKDIVRTNSLAMSAPGVCNVGIMESSSGSYVLGVTFLRSVYLAYRFPTASCPAYWGFATPKGVSLPTSSKNQKPKATPTDAATCLSFTAPTSTPTPTMQSGSGGSMPGSSGEKYAIYGQPDMAQVELRGVTDLPPLKAAGAIFGLGD
ncbi:hypothetical protein FRC12_010826 [Ceratobasidium sp. 428]|nr:hypothetical protein FRC12_010826 [Ceratobasidium sp. 428]